MKQIFDKNSERFASLMVEKIESMAMDWQKPWFHKVNTSRNFIPQNLNGRPYSGGNAFLLFFLCEKYNYQTPVFLTFNQAKEKGISILKGSKSFPVYYPIYYAYRLDTKERISLDEYKALSDEEKQSYKLHLYYQYYYIFNLDQTNFSEIFPEKWDKLFAQYKSSTQNESNSNILFSNIILEQMLLNNSWVCPINHKCGDSAFYSPSSDNITLPLKEQFIDTESYYHVALHEMSHSTGIKERLNRKGFYETDLFSYGREELVAELSSALAGLYLGISTTIREENAAYLQSWCNSIKEDPKYIFSVLSDAVKSVRFISNQLGFRLDNEILNHESPLI